MTTQLISKEDLLEVTEQLPASPQLIPRLQSLLYDPDADMEVILPLVKLDASITSGAIRLANSAYFRGSERVESLEDAISRLGLFELYRIVCLVVADQVLGRELPLYHHLQGEMLLMSIGTGVAMDVAAKKGGTDEFDNAAGYTLGLLHSVGKIIINKYYQENGLTIYDRETVVDPVMERKILGFDHAKLGSALLEKWGFPESLVVPVEYQNEPLTAESYKSSACLLNLASYFRPLVIGSEAEESVTLPELGPVQDIIDHLKLDDDFLVSWIEASRDLWDRQKALVNSLR